LQTIETQNIIKKPNTKTSGTEVLNFSNQIDRNFIPRLLYEISKGNLPFYLKLIEKLSQKNVSQKNSFEKKIGEIIKKNIQKHVENYDVEQLLLYRNVIPKKKKKNQTLLKRNKKLFPNCRQTFPCDIFGLLFQFYCDDKKDIGV
jgi:hypothetical protein